MDTPDLGVAVGVLWIMPPSIGTIPASPHKFWCFLKGVLGSGSDVEPDLRQYSRGAARLPVPVEQVRTSLGVRSYSECGTQSLKQGWTKQLLLRTGWAPRQPRQPVRVGGASCVHGRFPPAQCALIVITTAVATKTGTGRGVLSVCQTLASGDNNSIAGFEGPAGASLSGRQTKTSRFALGLEVEDRYHRIP